MTQPIEPPTQEQLEVAIKLHEDIKAILRGIDTLGYRNSDLSHASIKLCSAERGLNDFIDKCQGKYPYKFEW